MLGYKSQLTTVTIVSTLVNIQTHVHAHIHTQRQHLASLYEDLIS